MRFDKTIFTEDDSRSIIILQTIRDVSLDEDVFDIIEVCSAAKLLRINQVEFIRIPQNARLV